MYRLGATVGMGGVEVVPLERDVGVCPLDLASARRVLPDLRPPPRVDPNNGPAPGTWRQDILK